VNEIQRIMRREIGVALSRKSFLFTALGLPLLAVLVFAGISILNRDASETPTTPSSGTSGAQELRTEGFVDHSGLIVEIPADLPDVLLGFSDEAAARAALTNGTIAAYYIVPADYLESGDLLYINPDYSLVATNTDQSWLMGRVLFANLLGNDPERIARAGQPMDVQVQPLTAGAPPSGSTGGDEDSSAHFYVPYGAMMILYVVILAASGLLLNSVAEEKRDRVVETLLLTVSPRRLLAGKILGLGAVGLLQAGIWFSVGYGLLRLLGRTVSLPPEADLPLSLVVWAILFFLLGYAIYASLMAGLGALVADLKESSQATILVIWPLLIPIFFIAALIERTNGSLAVGLSLFPLTAPVAMIARLAVGGVPLWQPLLAVVLMLLTILLVVRAVGGIFRAQTLLSGQPFSIKRFVLALSGRL
jgi:ABC-2 type transport system permease protein